MLRTLLFTLFLLLMAIPELSACSCDGPGTFCQTLTPWRSQSNLPVSIFTAQLVNRRMVSVPGVSQPLMDVVVTEVLWGTDLMVGDTLALIGQDGVNCAVSPSVVNDSLEQVFGVWGTWGEAGDPEYRYQHQQLSDCGVTILQIEDDMVFGPIAPGVDSLSFAEFKSSNSFCIAGPIDEGCNCTTLVVDFCDEVGQLQRSGYNLGIVRLRQLFNILPAFDSSGYLVSLNSAVITEVLRGDAFNVGDTVAVVLQDDRGCVEWNSSSDALWAYTAIDTAGVVFTSRWNNYPRLLAPGCSQNTAEIVNDSVLTLPGLVAYPEYLGQLMDCLPPVSAEEATAVDNLRIYPNPVADQLTVRWQNARINALEIFSAEGRVVLEQRVMPSQDEAMFVVDGLSPGIYFLRLRGAGTTLTRKVIVAR